MFPFENVGVDGLKRLSFTSFAMGTRQLLGGQFEGMLLVKN